MEHTPSAVRRQPIITLRMHEVAEELAAAKRTSRPGTPTHRARTPEALLRCFSFCRFFWTCTTGACCSMAPPALAAAELLCIALIYFLAVPNSWPTHTSHLHYGFCGSAEDVALLSLLRCAAVTLAHALGAGPRFQRPYLLTATGFAAVSLPLGLMKLAVLRQSQWAHRQWPPFVAMYLAHMAFGAAQVLAAQRVVEWARARWEHGLGGPGFPWQEGEQAWLLAGQLESQAEQGREAACDEPGGDVPAQQLADPDSRWVQCDGLRVHYKLSLPLGQRPVGDTALVLVHSFGGGVFSWRHMQQPLADACGLPVLAFDRPGFGLTERPSVTPKSSLDANPYSLKCQALLTLKLASALGLRRMVLAGHGDGALLALLATAIACREQALGSPLRSPTPDCSGQGDGNPCAAVSSDQAGVLPGPGATTAVPMQAAPHHQRRGSLPDSLDWAWMSSLPEGHGSTILQRLLRGEWPASIEPRTAGGGSLLAGWAGGRPGGNRRSPQRSPQRPQQPAAAASELLEPLLELELDGSSSGGVGRGQQQQQRQEQQEQQQPGGPSVGTSSSTEAGGGLLAVQSSMYDNPSFLAGSRCATEQDMDGPAPAQQESSMALSSVYENPSFLSQSSDREQGQGTRYSTQEAAVQLPALAEQQEWEEQAAGQSSSGQAGGVLEEAEAGLLGLDLHDNPSFLADSFDAEAAAAAHTLADEQQRQQEGAAASAPEPAVVQEAAGGGSPEVTAEACGRSLESSGGGMWQAPKPVGLILLHPDLSGSVAPKYARVLAHSRLGRRVLRSLLRTEMGEVTNRRAWADPHLLSPDLLELYRRPLHVQGWDVALIEVARAHSAIHSLERAQLLAAVVDAGLPVLVATGEQDHLVPPSAVSRIAERLGAAAPRLAVLPRCGHLSHEEVPGVLLDFCQTFILEAQAAEQQR